MVFNLSFKCSGEHIFIGLLMAPTKTPILVFLGQNEDHGRKLKNSFNFLYVLVHRSFFYHVLKDERK